MRAELMALTAATGHGVRALTRTTEKLFGELRLDDLRNRQPHPRQDAD